MVRKNQKTAGRAGRRHNIVSKGLLQRVSNGEFLSVEAVRKEAGVSWSKAKAIFMNPSKFSKSQQQELRKQNVLQAKLMRSVSVAIDRAKTHIVKAQRQSTQTTVGWRRTQAEAQDPISEREWKKAVDKMNLSAPKSRQRLRKKKAQRQDPEKCHDPRPPRHS